MQSRYPFSRRRFLGALSFGAAAFAVPSLLRSAAPGASSQRKLGVALVGLGRYSSGQLAPALAVTQHCRLAGVVTGSREKGLDWAQRHGFSEKNVYHYDTMGELAGNPEIDIVYVVTPNALHAAHAIAAAKAGKHVICEKPMGVSVAECDAIIAACRSAGVKLSMGYRLHFDPYHRELMRMATDPTVAPFEKVDGKFSFVLRNRAWRAERKLAGGGPLMDLGIYLIQAACMAVQGPSTGGGKLVAPVAVTAREHPKSRPELFADVEEAISGTMEFANGTRADFLTSYQASNNEVRAESKRGWIEIGPAFGYRGLRGRTHAGELNFEPVNQQALQMDDFAQCVLHDRESRVGGDMGRRDMVVIEAIYEAARTGRRVAVRA